MTTTLGIAAGSIRLPGSILCVDDEPNILSALRRLFRNHGYQVFTADSADSALTVLEAGPVDIVISDMRMPMMNGAALLEQVRARWPDTLRMLLTGYADIQSILDSINRGEIYRYITKPWDENDILLVVRHALERKALEQEKLRLEAVTRAQNDELKALNANLETLVGRRTAQLQDAHNELAAANEKLKTSFLTSIKVFSNMVEMRGGHLAGHSRRVADLARRIAQKMGLDARDTQEIFVSGLLHSIGKVALTDELLAIPVSLMTGDQLGLYRKYPVRGEQLLTPLEDLRGAASIVRSHQERFDGKGFPDQLSGLNIPVGARIIALASDYHSLQSGALIPRRVRSEDAAKLIASNHGKRYDPMVVNAFQDVLTGHVAAEPVRERAVRTDELQPGMVTSRDLITRDGFLLLSADYALTERLIRQIDDYEKSMGLSFTVYIYTERRGS